MNIELTPSPEPPVRRSSSKSGLSFCTWQSAGYALLICLVFALFFTFSTDYFRENLQQAGDFLLSPHFIALVLVGIIICWKGIPDSRYDLVVLTVAVAYVTLFYGKFLSLYTMSGDSTCQVAYWNVLWHPNLRGSIGVAAAKPGQVFALGIMYQLDSLLGVWANGTVFKAGLIAITTVCIWSLVRMAFDIGGRFAGFLAFLMTIWAFYYEFLVSESTVYFIAALFSGLRIYLYRPHQRTLGRLLLVSSILFRIDSIAILAVIWMWLAARKEWRELRLLTIFTLGSIAVFLLTNYLIQGSFARLNSGAAAGYVNPFAFAGVPLTAMPALMFQTLAAQFAVMPTVRFLTIMAIIGVAGTITFGGRSYLAIFAGPIIIFMNVLLLDGSLFLWRYFSYIYAFACAIGSASLVSFLRVIFQKRRPQMLVIASAMALLLLLTFTYGNLNSYKNYRTPDIERNFLIRAQALLEDNALPAKSGLLSEDDLLSYLVVMEPNRFRKINSMQYFNVSSDEKRREILADTDYIWLELRGHDYFYLRYLDDYRWESDSFRLLLKSIMGDGRERSMYGFRIIPVTADENRMLLSVIKT